MRKFLLISVVLMFASACGSGSSPKQISIEAMNIIPSSTTTSTSTTSTTISTTSTIHSHISSTTKTTSRASISNHVSVPGDPWGCIRQYESGGTTNPAGSNISGEGYYGFTDSTWHSVGGTGQASDHSYEEQTTRAQILQQRSGWGQWSTAKRCGLI